MDTAAPNGAAWSQYVRTGAIHINPTTGLLAGPWAECIVYAVLYEHSNDWSSLPDYAIEGPAGGVLEALEAALAGNPDRHSLQEAAEHLEVASHAAAHAGRPLPVIGLQALGAQERSGQPAYGQHGHWEPQGTPDQQGGVAYPQPPSHAQPGFGHAYGQHGHWAPQELPYQQQHLAHSQPPSGPSGHAQPGYGQPLPQGQGAGMSAGAKMAMAAAGGLAAGGLAAYGLEAAGGFGGIAEAVGHAGEEAAQWMGDAGHGIEDMVDDIF